MFCKILFATISFDRWHSVWRTQTNFTFYCSPAASPQPVWQHQTTFPHEWLFYLMSCMKFKSDDSDNRKSQYREWFAATNEFSISMGCRFHHRTRWILSNRWDICSTLVVEAVLCLFLHWPDQMCHFLVVSIQAVLFLFRFNPHLSLFHCANIFHARPDSLKRFINAIRVRTHKIQLHNRFFFQLFFVFGGLLSDWSLWFVN